MSRKLTVTFEMKALTDAFKALGEAMTDFGRDKRLKMVIGRKHCMVRGGKKDTL